MNGFEEKYTEETLVKIYLDWVNNFLSVSPVYFSSKLLIIPSSIVAPLIYG